MAHIPVLLKESIEGLVLRPGMVYFDGTLGAGGHAVAAYESVGGALTVLGCDRDEDALVRSRERLESVGCSPVLFHGTFDKIGEYLAQAGYPAVDAILLDLGVSSFQIDDSGRGFTFLKDEPLLMTMQKEIGESDFSAADIVNTWGESSIADIIFGYGEERYARRIARAIISAREVQPIKTTHELVEVIKQAVPASYRHGRIHPATRTFQALRIAVNDELQIITRGLDASFRHLKPGGRLAVISFHSLEDRIVKTAFRKFADEDESGDTHAMVITKKPLCPTEEEFIANPRSRSAKLRIIQKVL